ncbi:response regulator [Asticcacaulis sp. ZE23SCel15]|uniref:response regulator n=1 Tax=Asticcacaulis sp. ZE23SCel15 TaxID=3059027 RepID=UPI00265ED466|nr:response regulator [Asticcacaulis sp. ZE23SCel15]WKL57072.1 response regulator [Asticcacaulis sp. ZE23SCel15]
MPERLKAPVHILLVDDLEENLLSLEALLRRDGLVLLKARSGPEALEILLKQEVALALLDVQMPEMDGFELAEMMRGSERTKRVPIMFLTAGTADHTRRFRGYEAGAVDFLQKPLEPDVLKSKVEVFFELYRQRQHIVVQRDALQSAFEENVRLLNESRKYAEALKDADRRKDEFLATLAHELRNPLAPIRNGLHILKMSPNPKIAEDVRDMMDRQMTHLVRLIDDLLDVSRVSQGKIDLRRERIDLQDVIRAALETSRPAIDAGRHEFILDMPDEAIPVNGDLTRLAQVVSNLLNNAAKYTPDGGKIRLTLTRDGHEARIHVADTGLGIERDMLPKVFELFTQVERNLNLSQGGLGIGLALAHRLVQMHGGTITAESAGENQGSTFTVHLPVTDIEGLVTEDATPQVAGGQVLDVLVVDDNRESAQTTSWMLELIGHQARMVHDGMDAIAAAKATPPDVILLDIGMPGMNGYEVCRELRKHKALKDTIIIAQTGWGQERDRKTAFEAGFDHHVTKPVSLDRFTQLLGDIQGAKPSPAGA